MTRSISASISAAHVGTGGGNPVERTVVAGSGSDGEHSNDGAQVVVRHIGDRRLLDGDSTCERLVGTGCCLIF